MVSVSVSLLPSEKVAAKPTDEAFYICAAGAFIIMIVVCRSDDFIRRKADFITQVLSSRRDFIAATPSRRNK